MGMEIIIWENLWYCVCWIGVNGGIILLLIDSNNRFEVNSGIELNVNAGPVGPQIDLGADLYLPGDTTITQYDLFSNLGSGIKREDYVHIIDEYWVD